MADEPTVVEEPVVAPEGTKPPAENAPAAVVEQPSPVEPKPYWPEDWRDKLAGKDEALRKRLSRFQSPDGVLKSWRALETRLSAGELRAALPEGATDDQVKAWRAENGIPEAPDGYLSDLPEGLVIGDDDKPLVSEFLAKMHAGNAPPAVVKQAVAWALGDLREQVQANRAEQDQAHHQEATDALYAEWGAELRSQMNGLKNYWGSIPGGNELLATIQSARTADGRQLGNVPEVTKWLVGIVNEVNPAAIVMPASGGSAQSIADEIALIEKVMRETPQKYYGDNAMQDRFKKLLMAQSRQSAA